MTDEWHPTPEMVLAVHDEIADEYDLKFTDTRGAAPIVRLQRKRGESPPALAVG
jgi:hypothetical protein